MTTYDDTATPATGLTPVSAAAAPASAPPASTLRTQRPGKQGLYDPQFEKDACGFGFVVDMKGRKSNAILKQAIQVLKNLDHRGACGCEKNTGDGACNQCGDSGEQCDQAKNAVAAVHDVLHQPLGAAGVESAERHRRQHKGEQGDPTERCAGENDCGGLSDCLHGSRLA